MATGMAGIEALKGLSAGLKTRMDKAVEDFRNNLVSVRTGRASVHMLDQVRVDYYGTEVPLSQVAQLKTPEAQLIVVEPWEADDGRRRLRRRSARPAWDSTRCTMARSSGCRFRR